MAAVLAYLESDGERVTARPLTCELPDPDDLPFLEVAAEVGALLITSNPAHYPETMRGAVQAFAPGEFIRQWSR